ncbi:MAG: divalent-cation tolerance protein CutA [Deltaproteobacteria bacterium]|nr:divalent-cation tolerance protein CutA [Deltaproteobacteria bacterium]
MPKALLVITTCPNLREAEKISKILVQKRLAACVQSSGPIKSFYRWKGKVEKAKEIQVFIKTTPKQLKSLIRQIRALHSFDLPQIISIPISGGLKGYLDWIVRETR